MRFGNFLAINKAFVLAISVLFGSSVVGESDLPWNVRLQSEIVKVSKTFDGEIGLVVQRVGSPEIYTMNASTPWYLASGVKLFILIELFKQANEGSVSLKEKVVIQKKHFRDGNGATKWMKPGSQITLRKLADRMMIQSDNSATDILIERLGLTKINATIKELIPEGAGKITSILEVRRLAYSEFHPAGLQLSNLQFMELRNIGPHAKKVARASKMMGVSQERFQAKTLRQAYERFYARGLNSSTLVGYASVLNLLARGQIVSPEASREILSIMKRCRTGGRRIKAGFPKGTKFAHKTGTRPSRLCDVGIAFTSVGEEVVVAACVKRFKRQARAERALRQVGEAITKSGVLNPPSTRVTKLRIHSEPEEEITAEEVDKVIPDELLEPEPEFDTNVERIYP